MRLLGKVPLITGGTSGLGLATAKLFVKEGAWVAVTGRDKSRFAAVVEELGAEALILAADVRSLTEMQEELTGHDRDRCAEAARGLVKYLVSVCLVLALMSTTASAASLQSPDEPAVKAVTEKFRATFARGDLDAISRLYTDDAKLLPPNAPAIAGRKAILAWFEANLRPYMPASLKFHDYEIYGGGNAATSVSWMELSDSKGRVLIRGKQTVVLLKLKGEWKIHRDMWSDDTPGTCGK
jgi:ketosteroid isomerase-like protein